MTMMLDSTATPFAAKTIVLITGANRGLGYETAKALARDHVDYHIMLGSRDLTKGEEAAERLRVELGGVKNIVAIQIDVTNALSIGLAARNMQTWFGRLDVLINNAGVLHEPAPHMTTIQTMQASFLSNTSGPAQVTESFIPLLQQSNSETGPPRIVFVSSRAGSIGFNIRPEVQSNYTRQKYIAPAYFASKAALNMLVSLYAEKYKDHGWKINASCPGFRRTGLSGFDPNAGKPEDGVVNTVRLAILGVDGETGTFSNVDGPIEG